jgi:ATP-dependent helicase/nuclease subunit A
LVTSNGVTIDAGAACRRPDSLESRIDARDREARERAVDPRHNVALEASAGTGKTRVLVNRYINLLRHGVAPGNILAMTFTRKAAAEMRERIITTLRTAAERGELTPPQWRELRDRMGDITISTIDAFCLSLLREFPLEADIDPGFSLADDTEVPRLVDESLDRTLRICRSVAREDEHVALVFAQLGDRRVRAGLAALLKRRIVAPEALSRHLTRGPRDLTVAEASRRGVRALADVFAAMKGGLDRFLETGPDDPGFLLLRKHLGRLKAAPTLGLTAAPTLEGVEPAAVQAAFAKVREYFLTQDGQPRSRMVYTKPQFRSAADWQTHRDLVVGHAPRVLAAHLAHRRDLNVLVSRGVSRMFRIAEAEYRRTLDAHAVLDFSDVLLRALSLLRQMEEFSQSRYRLESRYHHVLVDEFQDTSRAQWELISLLVQSWGEGAGLAHAGPLPPSIFIVGDRKQSIYGFRDAQASILREATAHLDRLRPTGDVRRSISRSFRSVPALLSFVNDVCEEIEKAPARGDAFVYEEEDRFPTGSGPESTGSAESAESSAVSMIVADSPEACAEETAVEVARLIASGAVVRDRDTGVRRPVRPADIAILFRTRESHREFEDALERRGIPSYVYKGLGFFDADEIKDVLALLWYLADSLSDLRTAAFLRSRFVRISDEGLRRLAPDLAQALRSPAPPAAVDTLDPADRLALEAVRAASSGWRGLVDRVPPAELLDIVLNESAYAVETRGPRAQQARENLKKIRALIRRIQNRGYATLGRIAAHLDRLAVGDEANAVIDAADAVSLMTVHAAKGLEFPIVFIVNLGRGTGSRRAPIRVTPDAGDDAVSVAVGDFQSEADEDEAAREREETKRLLYVALTRARDRLYLSSPLKDGRLVPGRGSLAEVLPASLLDKFGPPSPGLRRAGPGLAGSGVQWRTHTIGVCASGHEMPAGSASEIADSAVRKPHELPADVMAVTDTAPPRVSVAAIVSAEAPMATAAAGGISDRMIGTLVHRLLQRLPITSRLDDEALGMQVCSLMHPEEAADYPDQAGLVGEVVGAYRRLRDDAELRELYTSGIPLHEVPFTMHVGDRIVRGTIDCLLQRGDHLTVLEFKTGRPRPEHQIQAELYTRAIRAAYPGATVDSRLFYTGAILT